REEASSRSTLDELKAQLEAARQSLLKAEERAASWRERVQGQAALVTERKVRLAQVKEQMEAARTSLERVTNLLEELQSRGQRREPRRNAAQMCWKACKAAAKRTTATRTRQRSASAKPPRASSWLETLAPRPKTRRAKPTRNWKSPARSSKTCARSSPAATSS